MGAFLSLAYGLIVYVFFLATFLYAIAFTGNLVVPKSIDVGASAPLAQALAVNLPVAPATSSSASGSRSAT